jgi:trk system potassium uptake protein TrkH
LLRKLGTHLGLGTLALILVCVDLVLGLRATVSRIFTIAELLLVVPWLATVRAPKQAAEARPGDEPPALRKRLFTVIVPVVVTLACLYAKWTVLDAARLASDTARLEYLAAYRTYAVVALVLSLVGLAGAYRVHQFLAKMADHPARLMLVSFGLLATLGGVLLTLPQSLRDPSHASLVDGLFTATSGVCVTGLAVSSIAEAYTPFGQAVLLVLIQIGGLGIMVLSAFFVIVVGQRMRARATAVMAEMIDADSFVSFRRTVLTIVLATLLVEGLGALALWGLFSGYYDAGFGPERGTPLSGPGDLRWAAVFHSVSAFCNAGFSIFRDGMVPFVGSPAVCAVIMLLIVVGGIGFPVLEELARNALARLRRQRPPRLTLHARAVLYTTAVLLVAGAVLLLPLEWGASMAHLSFPSKLLAAFFQSVTLRTAGFNTVDFGAMRPATLFVACVFMLVGGSPGSTAGGIKTTTLFVLTGALRAELAGFAKPRMLGRSLGQSTVRRATALAFLSVLLVSIIVFALLLTEDHDPHRLLFEAVSAFGTVGLSTGLTAELSTPGKLVVIVTMFVGRVGPMTLALALAARSGSQNIELPEERLGIG